MGEELWNNLLVAAKNEPNHAHKLCTSAREYTSSKTTNECQIHVKNGNGSVSILFERARLQRLQKTLNTWALGRARVPLVP